PASRTDGQADDPIILRDWSNRRRPNPFGASFQCRIEQDFIESAPHDVPGLIRDLDIFMISTLDRNIKRIFTICPVKSSAIFDWVLPSFHRVAQTEFSQSHSRSPRHRFTDVIARENVPLNDNRTDSASEQIHSGRGSSRAAAYDNGRVLFLRYAGHFFAEVSRTIYK